MKKLMCLLTAAALCLSMTACEKKLSEGTVKSGFCYDNTGIAPDAVVMLVDDVEIPMDMYLNTLFTNCMAGEQMMAQYGLTFDLDFTFSDGLSMADVIREETVKNLNTYAMVEKLTKEHNIILSESEIAAVSAERAETIAQFGGEEAYAKELEKAGLSEETYLRLLRIQHLHVKLQELYNTEGSELYVSDDVLAKYAADNGYMTADHILIEGLEEASKAQAEAILEKLKSYSGSDLAAYFTELADEHSQDPGHATNPDGYTFGLGEMVESFENAALALEPGQFSDLVESQYGYHIILRKELDPAPILDDLRSDYFTKVLCAPDESKVSVNDALAKLDLAKLYETFMAIQNGTQSLPDLANGG